MNDRHDMNAGFDPGADADSGPPDRTLDDLIARHLDGGLDPDGQRRLADRLAGSADARRTLASYLRLEGATLRLAVSGLLGGTAADRGFSAPGAGLTSALLPPAMTDASGAARHRARWLWPASLAMAASLLAAVVLSHLQPRDGWPEVVEADIDRLADRWLALARDAGAEVLVTADTVSAADAAGLDAGLNEPPEGIAAPPRWLVAALADDGAGPANPDDG